MNQSHIIDSWIAELGLSSRRLERKPTPARERAEIDNAGRPDAAPRAPWTRPTYPRARPRRVIASPC